MIKCKILFKKKKQKEYNNSLELEGFMSEEMNYNLFVRHSVQFQFYLFKQ